VKSESINEGVIVVGGVIGIAGVAVAILTGQFSNITTSNIEATVIFVIGSGLALGLYIYFHNRRKGDISPSANESEKNILLDFEGTEGNEVDGVRVTHGTAVRDKRGKRNLYRDVQEQAETTSSSKNSSTKNAEPSSNKESQSRDSNDNTDDSSPSNTIS